MLEPTATGLEPSDEPSRPEEPTENDAMKVTRGDSRFDATPDRALNVVLRHRGPVVVDFDETLLLANSTQLFLSTVKPQFLVYLLVKVAALAQMTLYRRSSTDLDTLRVRWVLTLLPWSRRTWQKQVPEFARELANQPLVDVLQRIDGPVVVSTMGFLPIVQPLLNHMGLHRADLVAIDPKSSGVRSATKLAATTVKLGPEGLASSVVLTDSLDDRGLLEAAAAPLLVVWPETRPVSMFDRVYVPGRYIAIKRPNSRYFRRIVQNDWALWILGSVWLSDNPVTHVVGLTILSLSFWAVYEIGYLDNDRIAERYEANPMLSELYHSRRPTFSLWKPVLFSLAAGALGMFVLRWPSLEALDLGRWGGVLVLTGLVFGTYNRLDKQTRVLLYPILQLFRVGAFIVVVPTTAIADAALIISVLTRWVPYFVYRLDDREWPRFDLASIRLIVFIAASLLLAAQHEWSDLWTPTTLSLLAWSLFMARHDLPRAIRLAHRIDRPGRIG